VTPLMRSMLLVFIGGVVGSFGAVFLKLGADKLGKSIWSFLNIRLAAGVALYLGSTVFYILGIKGGQLTAETRGPVPDSGGRRVRGPGRVAGQTPPTRSNSRNSRMWGWSDFSRSFTGPKKITEPS
jgi:hypothetical protein